MMQSIQKKKLKTLKKSNGLCKICRKDIESVQHMFYQCGTIRKLWNRIEGVLSGVLGIHITLHEKDVILSIYEQVSDKVSVINFVIMNAKWIIWKSRNNKKYNNVEYSLDLMEKLIWQECENTGKIIYRNDKIPVGIKSLLGQL